MEASNVLYACACGVGVVVNLADVADDCDSLFGGEIRVSPFDESKSPASYREDIARDELPCAYVAAQGGLRALAFPASFSPDVYYAQGEDGLIMSDSLLSLCEHFGGVSFDSTEVAYFLTKGYCHPANTLVSGIHRFEGYSLYLVSPEGCFVRSDLGFEALTYGSDEERYADFKRRVDSSVDFYLERFEGRNHQLLLSGGADSRLLFLSLIKRGVGFGIQTFHYSPYTIDDNAQDCERAKSLADRAGVPCNVTPINLDSLDVAFLRDVVAEMPCCSHGTVGFRIPIDGFADANTLIWTGQNIDSMYNMGATQRLSLDKHAVAQWFKRFYMSEPFFASLPDVEGRPSLRSRLAAQVGVRIFEKGYGDPHMSLPENSIQLERRFDLSDDYVVLRDGCDSVPSEARRMPLEVKQALFKSKLGYVRSGDPQSISSCARLNGADVAFPYTNTPLVQWFHSYPLTWKDVNSPKRFVYRYVRELAGEIDPGLGTFRPIPVSRLGGYGKMLDLYDWAARQQRTRLFEQMREIGGGFHGGPERLEGLRRRHQALLGRSARSAP